MSFPKKTTLALLACSLIAAVSPGAGQTLRSVEEGAQSVAAGPAEIGQIDWTRNLGRLFLDVERELFGEHVLLTPSRRCSFEDGYRLLEKVFEAARSRLGARPPEGRDPLETLIEIHRLLVAEGFSYKDYSARANTLLGYHTLSFGMARREIDCSMYVVLYLAIAEELGLPLVAISLPEHLSLRWVRADGSYLNWEATVPNCCEDAFYLDWKHPSRVALEGGVYLRGLTREEVLATAFYEKGRVLGERGQDPRAREAAECAAVLGPRYPDAFNLKGLLVKKLGSPVEAVASFDRAIDLDPAFTHAYFNRARCRLALGRRAEALEDFAALQLLEPDGVLSRQLGEQLKAPR